MDNLICCHCKQSKLTSEFYRDRSRKTGFRPRCKVCEKLYVNKELRRKYEKEYRLKNPEKRKKILANWYIENKASYTIYLKKYRQTEGYKILRRNHDENRRARLRNQFVEKVDLYSIYLQSPFCFYCKKPLLLNGVEFDHFIPLAKGGLHCKENIRVSCCSCNRRKGVGIYQVV